MTSTFIAVLHLNCGFNIRFNYLFITVYYSTTKKFIVLITTNRNSSFSKYVEIKEVTCLSLVILRIVLSKIDENRCKQTVASLPWFWTCR